MYHYNIKLPWYHLGCLFQNILRWVMDWVRKTFGYTITKSSNSLQRTTMTCYYYDFCATTHFRFIMASYSIYGIFNYILRVFNILWHLMCENLNLGTWFLISTWMPTSWCSHRIRIRHNHMMYQSNHVMNHDIYYYIGLKWYLVKDIYKAQYIHHSCQHLWLHQQNKLEQSILTELELTVSIRNHDVIKSVVTQDAFSY